MAVQIVLLRGINVGGHRKVPMADLRAMCAGEGFGAVATHVQSGNVVFIAQSSAEETQRVVEAAIERTFGFPVDVVVVDKAAWKTLIEQNPLPEQAAAEPKRTMLALAKGPLPIDLVERLTPYARSGETLRVAGEGLYMHYPTGAGTSKLPGVLDRQVGAPTTVRNWNTVLALWDLADRRQ